MILLPMLFGTAWAQTYPEFMRSVERNNASYIAERYNIDIAEANSQAAKVFNDPELSFDYSDNQDRKLMMGQSAGLGLSYNFSLGGVRKARMAVALEEEELTRELLDDYFRRLRLEATEAWAGAWLAREMLAIKRSSFESMRQVALSDSLRATLGEIGPTDAAQSSLEARSMLSEVLQAEAEYSNALSALSLLAGGIEISRIDDKDLVVTDIQEPVDILVSKAQDRRADLRAAYIGKTLSQKNLRLVNALRAPELGLNAGYSYNTEVRNEIAPAPAFKGVTVGVTIPLKFSSANKGEKLAARKAVEQADAAYEAALQQIETEVRTAYSSYIAAKRTVLTCSDEMLASASAILGSRLKAYQSGDSSLLDYLLAARVYNDTAEACVKAKADLAVRSSRLLAAVSE